MVKRVLAALLLVALLMAGSLFLLRDVLQAQGPPAFRQVPEDERIFDADRDKLFDNLEARIAPAAHWEPFEVIVLFRQPLEELDLEGLFGRLGSFEVRHRYHSINGISTTLTRAQIEAAARLDIVRQVELNARVRPFLDGAREWSGVDKARTDFGVDGNTDGLATYSKDDIVIAVIDTGIDTGHVDLDEGKVIGWKDFATGEPDPYDEDRACVYHGTHVSSIAAGEGEGNASYRGVAPGAALVGLKVLTRVGGDCTGTIENVNAAIQWVIDNKNRTPGTEGGAAPDMGIEVANMSLGIAGCSDGTDSTSLLVNQAVEAGVVMAVAAGNEGPGTCTVGSPAAAAKAVTLGAMADVAEAGFALASWSSRGPTADGRVKPDIAAPGVTIMAASGGTASDYKELSGTSMSSPFTAGVAALLLHANPSLSPQEVKSVLMLTAHDWGPLDGSTYSGPASDIDYGAGRLDAYRAVKAALQSGGANIALPQHRFYEDSLTEATGSDPEDLYTLAITDTTLPIAATLIMPTWSGGQPDFDLQLKDAAGTVVASASTTARQETIRYAPPTDAGPYTLRVFAYPGWGPYPPSEAGPYLLDISAGTATVAIQLTTDGWTPFGNQSPGATIDTSATGTNDVQTVEVTTGPANLFIQTTRFTDGVNTWALGTSAGTDRAVWEFSTNGSTWTKFTAENELYSLAPGVAEGGTVDLYLRLTLPTTVSAPEKEYGATVTITAVPPP